MSRAEAKRSPKKASRLAVAPGAPPARVRRRSFPRLALVPPIRPEGAGHTIENHAVAERAPTGPRKPGDEAVFGDLPLSQQISRIGGNLRPQDVSQIIVEADTGDIRRLMDLGNEARQKDGHLQGVLFTRETTLASLPWQVEPYTRDNKNPKAKDADIAEWVTDRLRDVYGNPAVELKARDDLASLRGLFAHMAGAAYFGFSPTEVMWARQDGYLVPTGFNLLQQRRFLFRQDDGRLCWSDVGMREPVDVMRAYAPGKFIVHRPRINGDVPCREGLIRPLMWAALFRNWDIRDWMSLAELAWKPYRTGYYTRDATPEDKDNLIQALKRVASSGIGVFAETTKFMVEWPNHSVSSGQSMHGELAAFFADEMSKCILGQTLTTSAGQKGARALGEVHDKVRGDIAESDAIQAANTIQAQLIGPMVRLNFGNEAKLPRFSFITEETAEIETFSKGVMQLAGAGTQIPSKWVRRRVGMPNPQPGEEVLKPVAVTQAEMAADASKEIAAGKLEADQANQDAQANADDTQTSE